MRAENNQNHRAEINGVLRRGAQYHPKIKVGHSGGELSVQYECRNSNCTFDVCHEAGRILLTGRLKMGMTRIDVSFLEPGIYIFLVMDGDIIRSHPFEVAR